MSWRSRFSKRDKKRAKDVSKVDLQTLLDRDSVLPCGHFLIGSEDSGYILRVWSRQRGMYECTLEDNAFAYAATEFLLENGKVFATESEAETYMIANGWAITDSNIADD